MTAFNLIKLVKFIMLKVNLTYCAITTPDLLEFSILGLSIVRAAEGIIRIMAGPELLCTTIFLCILHATYW